VRATPAQPAEASIVAPATIDERLATSAYLAWVADVLDVAGQNETRARMARAACRAPH